MHILVIDIGGSHVKLLASHADQPRQFDSSAGLTPSELVVHVGALTRDWPYDAVSIGYPGRTVDNRLSREPGNLGSGWVGFDFESALRAPVRLINDAAMQALGAYGGGRMLFLGLGTGLGSALVSDHTVVPLELGSLRFSEGETMADRLSKRGLERLGVEAWNVSVAEVVWMLKDSFVTDEVVLGGGNAGRVEPLPSGARRGGGRDAFIGGYRLWEACDPTAAHTSPDGGWRFLA